MVLTPEKRSYMRVDVTAVDALFKVTIEYSPDLLYLGTEAQLKVKLASAT